MEDLTSVFGKAGNKSDYVLLEPQNDLFQVGPARSTLGQWLGIVNVAAKGTTKDMGSSSECSANAHDLFLSKNSFGVSKRGWKKNHVYLCLRSTPIP